MCSQTCKQVNTLVLVGPVPPPNGGMSLQTIELRKRLRQQGMCVQLIPTNPRLWPKVLGRVKGIRAIIRLFILLWMLGQHLRKSDLVHVMSNSGWSWYLYSMPTIIMSALFRTPIVINYRGGGAASFFQRHMRWIKPFMRRAKRIVVPSAFLAEVFSQYDLKTTVISNCVDTKRFRPEPSRHEGFCCLIARNLEFIYGLDIGIKAYAKALTQCPDMRLMIAGEGPERSKLQALVESLHLSEVKFLGRLSRKQMSQAYRQADVLLNPARVDNMPNALLEAQASGLAIITTDAGGIPYMVEHHKTAWMVKIDDVDGMANALIELYHHQNLRQSLRNNSLAHIQEYTWPVAIGQWQKIYQQVGQI